jgi:hypothetical protein
VANHYATLGLERGATAREVVHAYRRLARLHHPDAGGDATRFLELQAAYDVLGDPAQRTRYDAARVQREPRLASPPVPPPRPQPQPASRVHRYGTARQTSLPLPSSTACGVAVTLALGTFVLPVAAAAKVFRAQGSITLLLAGLVAALVCGKAARSVAAGEAERARRHRQLWSYKLVMPESAAVEHVARCAQMATLARHCAGFGLAGAVAVICALGALAAS